MSSSIDTVVFDVGWVLVRLDYQALLDYLRAHGAPFETLKQVVPEIDLQGHESGLFPGERLLDNLAALIPGRGEREALRRHWTDMFEPVDEMFALARGLAMRYEVYLLSNVGDLHWTHLNERFHLADIGHGALPSFEAGVMKPDARIYEQAERRFGLVPARTVFIDDLEPNVQAARARGWHAIQHHDPADTIERLQALGLDITPAGSTG